MMIQKAISMKGIQKILSQIAMETLAGVEVAALLHLIPIEGDALQTTKETLSPTPSQEETLASHILKEDQRTKRMHPSFTGLEMVKDNPTVRSQCL